MKYCRLGMWGLKLSEIGFGSWLTLNRNDQNLATSLHRVAYERGIKARDEGRVTADRILDVNFRDFMTEPFETIRHIYGFAGLDFTSEVEERMRAFLASNPDDKHGKHSYGFADTGLDETRERERVRGYQERFQVPSEPL